MTRREYSKELTQPILILKPELEPLPGGPTLVWHRDSGTLKFEREIKLIALFEHYGIDQGSADAWELLARSLALHHVPGFRTTVKQGRPTKDALPFYRYVSKKIAGRIATHNDPSISHAIKLLARDATFKRDLPEYATKTAGHLQNLYSKVKVKRLRLAQHHRGSRSRKNADNREGSFIDDYETS